MKNCGVVCARFKQRSEARRTFDNETPKRSAVNWIGWCLGFGVGQGNEQLARGSKENGLSLGRRLIRIHLDSPAPGHGTIQKGT